MVRRQNERAGPRNRSSVADQPEGEVMSDELAKQAVTVVHPHTLPRSGSRTLSTASADGVAAVEAGLGTGAAAGAAGPETAPGAAASAAPRENRPRPLVSS